MQLCIRPVQNYDIEDVISMLTRRSFVSTLEYRIAGGGGGGGGGTRESI